MSDGALVAEGEPPISTDAADSKSTSLSKDQEVEPEIPEGVHSFFFFSKCKFCSSEVWTQTF